MWAWLMLIYLGVFGQLVGNNVCQLVGTVNRNRQIEVFLYLFRGEFLEIDVFYSIFVHICKKIYYFRLSFNLSACLLHFPSKFLGFPSKFRGKKRHGNSSWRSSLKSFNDHYMMSCDSVTDQ